MMRNWFVSFAEASYGKSLEFGSLVPITNRLLPAAACLTSGSASRAQSPFI